MKVIEVWFKNVFPPKFIFIGLSGSSSGSTAAGGTGQNTTAAQLTHVLRNWNYCLQLAHFMYQVGGVSCIQVTEREGEGAATMDQFEDN